MHSALVPPFQTVVITYEVKVRYPSMVNNELVHIVPAVPRHQTTFWVVPLNCSGHWCTIVLPTEEGFTPARCQRHISGYTSRLILQVSSRDCSERGQQVVNSIGSAVHYIKWSDLMKLHQLKPTGEFPFKTTGGKYDDPGVVGLIYLGTLHRRSSIRQWWVNYTRATRSTYE